MASASTRTAVEPPQPRPSSSSAVLQPYVLQPPSWRAPLLATSNPAPPQSVAYPELFPGATALFPQQAASSGLGGGSGVTYAGIGRDSSAALGIVSASGAKEDDLNEQVVKTGFLNKPVVQTEAFSAHQLIHNKLYNGPSIPALSRILQRVIQKRERDIQPEPGPWTYKPPSRVVLNEARREAWLNDLANPATPLSKLAKTIPAATSSGMGTAGSSGSTGTGVYAPNNAPGSLIIPGGDKNVDKNLEMLASRQVQHDRAVWYLRAVGGAEIQQANKARSASGVPAVVLYTAEFTTSLLNMLARQLSEMVLPLTHHQSLSSGLGNRPGMSLKGRARNIIAEPEGRVKWLNKWTYTYSLLQAIWQDNDEGLIDRYRFTLGILQWWKTAHIALLGWTGTILSDLCLETVVSSESLSKACLLVIIDRMEELHRLKKPAELSDGTQAGVTVDGVTTASTMAHDALEVCREIVRDLCRCCPETLLLPQLWQSGKISVIKEILLEGGDDRSATMWEDLSTRIQVLNGESQITVTAANDPLTANSERRISLAPPTSHTTGTPGHLSSESVMRSIALLDQFDIFDSVEQLSQDFFYEVPESETRRGSASSGVKKPSGTPSHPTPPSIGALHFESTTNSYYSHTPNLKVLLLLDWATSSVRFGTHRRHLACQVLKTRFSPRRDPKDDMYDASVSLQPALLTWLDATKDCQAASTVQATLELYHELHRAQLFNFATFLQSAIARGVNFGDQSRDQRELSTCQDLLDQLDLDAEPESVHFQLRKLGAGKQSPQERKKMMCDRLCDEVRSAHPWLSVTSAAPFATNTSRADPSSYSPNYTPLPCRSDVYERVILGLVKDGIKLSSSSPSFHAFCCDAIRLYEAADVPRDLYRLLEVLIQEAASLANIISTIHAAVRSHLLTWTAMRCMPQVATLLWTAHRRLMEEGRPSIQLLSDIVELGKYGHLPQDTLDHLAQDLGTMQDHQVSAMLSRSSVESAIQLSAENLRPFLAAHPYKDASLIHFTRLLCCTSAKQPEATENLASNVMTLLQQTSSDVRYGSLAAELCLTVQDQNLGDIQAGLTSWFSQRTSALATNPLFNPASMDILVTFIETLVGNGCMPLSAIIEHVLLPTLGLLLEQAQTRPNPAVTKRWAELASRLLASSQEDSIQIAQSVAFTEDGLPGVLQLLCTLYSVNKTAQQQDDFREAVESLVTLQKAVIANEIFVRAILRHFSRYSSLLLESAENDVRALQVLADILTTLKPQVTIPPSLNSQTSNLTAPASSPFASVWMATITSLELRVYLCRMKTESSGNASVSQAPSGPPFASSFLENVLASSSETQLVAGIESQLAAFTGSAVQQLVLAAISSLTQDMEAYARNASASAQVLRTTFFSRTRHTCSILVMLLRTSSSTIEIMQDVDLASRFAVSWSTVFAGLLSAQNRGVRSADETALAVLVQTVCLGMRWMDLWQSQQISLSTVVEALLRECTSSQPSWLACSTQEALLDLLSVLMDNLQPANRYKINADRLPDGTQEHLNARLRALTFQGTQPRPAVISDRSTGKEYLTPNRAWELLDHTDQVPENMRDAVALNNGSIDLRKVQAKTIDPCSSAPSRQILATPYEFHIGDERNFDSEIPSARDSLWQRDFRRSLTTQMELPPPAPPANTEEVAASAKKTAPNASQDKAAANPNDATVTAQASGNPPATSNMQASTTSKKTSVPKKRKSTAETATNEDESTKRKKTANKSTKKK